MREVDRIEGVIWARRSLKQKQSIYIWGSCQMGKQIIIGTEYLVQFDLQFHPAFCSRL